MSDRSRRRKNPLSTFGEPSGNRKEMCIRCYKPETNRAFVVHGDINWLAAALIKFAGLPDDEAMGTAQEIYNDPRNTDNKVGERHTHLIRLCRGCAKLTGVPLYRIERINEGGEVRGVIQPDNI